MGQWVEALATKAEDLSSILGIRIEKERQLPQIVLSPLITCDGAYSYTNKQIIEVYLMKNRKLILKRLSNCFYSVPPHFGDIVEVCE